MLLLGRWAERPALLPLRFGESLALLAPLFYLPLRKDST